MVALGFLTALLLMRRLSQRANLDPLVVTKVLLYLLIVGVIGARVFFVVHYFDFFRGNLLRVFAVWGGGLEFLGGVILVTSFVIIYLCFHKLPLRRYMDIMAIGLMMGLAVGRIGCLLNGCCFGKPTTLSWGMRFPYRSVAYISQINPNPQRGRLKPYLDLPRPEYFSFHSEDGRWYPKPLRELTTQQQYEVTKGGYRCLPVHPSQLSACASALLLCFILHLFWCKTSNKASSDYANGRFGQPGLTVGLMFTLYGFSRFLLEFMRDDNPFELSFLTMSQIISVFMLISGIVMFTLLLFVQPNMPNNKTSSE